MAALFQETYPNDSSALISLALVELGLAPWEAEAVLSQNWQALGDMGMDRVAVLLSDYVGVSPEIFYAAFNQDWGKVYEYAQVEIAQRLLTALAL